MGRVSTTFVKRIVKFENLIFWHFLFFFFLAFCHGSQKGNYKMCDIFKSLVVE